MKGKSMRKVTLGATGIEITPLIYGTLVLGKLQGKLTPAEGGRLIRHALEAGVDMLDTAELYGSYPHIREGLKGFTGPVRIASKTHAPTPELAREHVEKGLRELSLDAFDIVHLHGADVPKPFTDRAAIIDMLLTLKAEGKVKHVGLSTHFTSVMQEALHHPEIEVLHPMINRSGMGLRDGSPAEMLAAVKLASQAGKGIYAMKVLAGGNFISDAQASIRYAMGVEGVDALAIGMLSTGEIDANLALVACGETKGQPWEELAKRERAIRVMAIACKGCGECAEACPSEAIEIQDGLAVVDRDKCILCGYCAAACPDFAIRVA